MHHLSRYVVIASIAFFSHRALAQTPPAPPPPPEDRFDPYAALAKALGNRTTGQSGAETAAMAAKLKSMAADGQAELDGTSTEPPASQPSSGFKDHWYLLGTGYGQLHDSLSSNGSAAFSLGVMKALTDDHGNELYEFVFAVSKGSANDTYTQQADMARFVLSPELSPISASFRFDYWNRTRRNSGLSWGWYGAIGAGVSKWQLPSTSGGTATTAGAGAGTTSGGVTDALAQSVVTVALHAGLSAFLWGTAGDNSVRIIAHAGLTNRTIAGDAFAHNDFLRSTIGSPQNDYFGAEGGFDLQLQDVTLGVQFPLMVGGVPGLTHGQLLPYASVGGKFDLGSSPAKTTDKPKTDTGGAAKKTDG